jgi:hypothetical protein
MIGSLLHQRYLIDAGIGQGGMDIAHEVQLAEANNLRTALRPSNSSKIW